MNLRVLLGVLFLSAFTWSLNGEAYFIASEPAQIRAGVPTDVFVAGFGSDQGTQFLHSAIIGAKVSRDRFPGRQRVIISAVSEDFHMEKAALAKAGFGFRKADDDDLTAERLVLAIQYLSSPVSSLHFFGHANTYNGFRLQSKMKRLKHDDPEFAQLGAFLAPTAFVVFNSCNSGWFLAITGAKLWNRPVFGSLGSSDFQEPMTDGKWYFHDVGYYPENLTRIGTTTLFTRSSEECTTKKCLRLKPANIPYRDDFGQFDKGLGFYKVFSTQEALIPQALIHYTLLLPSIKQLSLQSSRAEFTEAVVDWMCPSDKNSVKHNACKQAIETKSFLSNRTMSFFNGTAVACGNTSCQTVIKCKALKKIFGATPCKTEDLSSAVSTSFSDQLRYFFIGLDQLEAGQLRIR
ncbi:hypothetical protein [Bdellovibrio reynosensis]|uniref:CHAT domain-containing protein n=1 Tax=Bdellovibrio reynosensis TaxID=2835041 RepID=A0ABY4C819_9BACT|nr:hypothetical protein [Bdellovibrio reynosensis]UOF01077.1 hypothetical protein MNR06_15355 [Bdellovibrio reynosensis]